MYYVYVLYSEKTGSLYKGYSSDIKERLKKHNAGSVKVTQFGRPWVLLYYEGFINKTDAIVEEIFLKTGKGRERINYLLHNTLNNLRKSQP